MYVRMYVCTYVRMYVCIHVCMNACVCVCRNGGMGEGIDDWKKGWRVGRLRDGDLCEL